MMDLSGVVARFSTKTPVTLIRSSAGSYVNGFYVPAAQATQSMIAASVQRAQGEDLELLEQGQRTKETIRLYTTQKLYPATVGGAPADRVVYQGRTYEVQSAFDYGENANYFKALAVMVPQ